MNAKLTANQAELLAAIQSGVRVHYVPYAGRLNPTAYYFRDDTMKRCTKAAKALLSRGLAKKSNDDWRGHMLVAVATTPSTGEGA